MKKIKLKKCFCGKTPTSLFMDILSHSAESSVITYRIYGNCCKIWNIYGTTSLSRTITETVLATHWNSAPRHSVRYPVASKKKKFNMSTIITFGEKYKNKTIHDILYEAHDYEYIYWLKRTFPKAVFSKEVLQIAKEQKELFQEYKQ